jgi:hypothetical protein
MIARIVALEEEALWIVEERKRGMMEEERD